MQVFIKNDDTITQEQKTKLGEQIRNLDGVNTVVFRTRDESLNQIKDSIFKDKPENGRNVMRVTGTIARFICSNSYRLRKSEQVKSNRKKMIL